MIRLGNFIAALFTVLTSSSALAIPVIGGADALDVTLAQQSSSLVAFSQENPASGNTSGFATTFESTGTGGWSFLGTTDSVSGARFTYGSLQIDFAGLATDTSGTWSVTNTDLEHDLALDLVIAIHASNASTAFLFNDLSVSAGQVLSGTWSIEWLNNGGNVPTFSNVAFFDRGYTLKTPQDDVQTNNPGTTPSAVPEPASLALLGVGLLAMTALRRRGGSGAHNG